MMAMCTDRPRFPDSALEQGFVVLAVDGEFGKPSVSDATDYRWALVATGRAAGKGMAGCDEVASRDGGNFRRGRLR